jgi:hypothetical protein
MSRKLPRPPQDIDIPRFVVRQTNHAFSHKYRLEPSEVIPEEWANLCIDLRKVTSDYPIEISSIIERTPGLVSERGLASYCQSVQAFLEKFLGVGRRTFPDRKKSFLSRLALLEDKCPPDEVKRFVDGLSRLPKLVQTKFYPGELIPQRLVWKKPDRYIIKGVPKTPEELLESIEVGVYPDIDLINQVLHDDANTIMIATKDVALVKFIFKKLQVLGREKCLIQYEAIRFDPFESAQEVLDFLKKEYRIPCDRGGHRAHLSHRIFGKINEPVSLLSDSGFFEKEARTLYYTECSSIINYRDLDSCPGFHMGMC